MSHTVTHQQGSVTLRIVDGVTSHTLNGRDWRPGFPEVKKGDHDMRRARAIVAQKYSEAIGFKRVRVGNSNKIKLVRA